MREIRFSSGSSSTHLRLDMFSGQVEFPYSMVKFRNELRTQCSMSERFDPTHPYRIQIRSRKLFYIWFATVTSRDKVTLEGCPDLAITAEFPTEGKQRN
jgi:hypothetical protein